MSLASIQRIKSIEKHPNADMLDIATVKGYRAIVRKDQYHINDLIIFIEPDSVLPDAPWTIFYKAKSSRVKAIKLRNIWSFGIIESIENVGLKGKIEEGLDVTEILSITKYEPPQPQELNVSGLYPFGIPKTDEEKYQNLEQIPYGELVDVTLKIDGQSWSAIYKISESDSPSFCGVGGRSFLYKLEAENNYTRNEKKFGILEKLKTFCINNNISLCLRGEQYGKGIQSFNINPYTKLPVSVLFYSIWLIKEHQYAHKGNPYYIFNIAPQMELENLSRYKLNGPSYIISIDGKKSNK